MLHVSIGTLFSIVLVSGAFSVHARSPHYFDVYFGTYTGAKSEGIYVSKLDTRNGALTEPTLAARVKNPSFLVVHPTRQVIYAVGEIGDFEGKRSGALSAFAIGKGSPGSAMLTLLNQQPSGGEGPCHLSLDSKGKWLFAANYGSGSVALFPILKDGSVGKPVSTIQHTGASVNPQRQTGPHAHHITTDPANRFVLACDLGLDKVLVYRLDRRHAKLVPNDPPFTSVAPGAGPRHLAFAPNGRFAYVINELNSTITVFAYDARRGAMSELQTVSTLPENFPGKSSCAEIQVHPSGKFVFGSNRGHDSIAVFAADEKSGRLSFVEHEPTQGKTPRHFAIDPAGRWLLAGNQGSDSVVVFAIDEKTGRLNSTGRSVAVGSPVCAVFVPGQKP